MPHKFAKQIGLAGTDHELSHLLLAVGAAHITTLANRYVCCNYISQQKQLGHFQRMRSLLMDYACVIRASMVRTSTAIRSLDSISHPGS